MSSFFGFRREVPPIADFSVPLEFYDFKVITDAPDLSPLRRVSLPDMDLARRLLLPRSSPGEDGSS